MVMRLTCFLACLACLLLLPGCGGGGGGGGSQSGFTAVADWSSFGNPISGNSMKWTLFTQNEILVQSISINRDQPAEQSATITGLPNGLYHLRVELFSNRDLGGSVVGVLDELISVTGNTTYKAAVGTAVTSIKVTPATLTFKVNQNRQFYAAGYNPGGKATFVAPDSITWQTLGGVATVNDDGIVHGTAQGNGSVVATHTPSSTQGGATITVQAAVVTTGKWTVLVYLNAANDLNEFGDLNVNQMEQVAGNSDVRFVVQWKQIQSSVSPNPSFVGTRRYLIQQDNDPDIVNSELVENMGQGVDMGSKDTLSDFIAWAKANYPAQRYCLVIWNHGNGWRRSRDTERPTRAVSYDDETQNAIQTWELAQALGADSFDILSMDASLMQMLEVAHEIQDTADYIAASEESPPGEGYPYHLVFDDFRDNPDASTLSLAEAFTDGTREGYESTGDYVTQSVIDTNQLPNVSAKVNALAQVLIANVSDPNLISLVQLVRNNAARYPRDPFKSDFRKYRDLWDVCDRLKNGTSIPALATACDEVKAAVEAAVKWEWHSANESGSHGIAIDFSPSSSFLPNAADYANLRFASDTQWNEWLAVAP